MHEWKSAVFELRFLLFSIYLSYIKHRAFFFSLCGTWGPVIQHFIGEQTRVTKSKVVTNQHMMDKLVDSQLSWWPLLLATVSITKKILPHGAQHRHGYKKTGLKIEDKTLIRVKTAISTLLLVKPLLLRAYNMCPYSLHEKTTVVK